MVKRALLLALACAGCTPPPHTLEIAFEDEALGARAVSLEVLLSGGSCADPDGALFRTQITRSDAGMALPTLPPGPIFVQVDARDADCAIIASTCEDFVLPNDDRVLSVVLRAATGPVCEGACVAGRCEGADAGPDASDDASDAGTDMGPDGGPPDMAEVDAPDAMVDMPPVELTPPVVISPWNGVTTGSRVNAGADLPSEDPLRPRVRWEPTEGAVSYQLQFAQCDRDEWTECGFAIVVSTMTVLAPATNARPSEPLPVATEIPLGARYVFRVGACADTERDECVFGPPRYIDVGRIREDLDGDGDGDLFSYIDADPDRIVEYDTPTSRFGTFVAETPALRALAWIGDHDGDGKGALAYIPADPADTRIFIRTDAGEDAPFDRLAERLAGVGDVDGDGYADFATSSGSVMTLQYGGAPRGSAVLTAVELDGPVIALSRAGDRDGDGNADVAVLVRTAGDRMQVAFFSFADRTAAALPVGEPFSTGEVGIMRGTPVAFAAGLDMDGNGRPEYVYLRTNFDDVTVVFDDGRRLTETGFGMLTRGAIAMGLLDGSDRARVVLGVDEGVDAGGRATGALYHLALDGDEYARTRIAFLNEERFGAAEATLDLTGNGRQDMVTLSGTGLSMHIGLFSGDMVGGSGTFHLVRAGRIARIPE